MRNVVKKQKGVSLIAAVFIIVILAFMGLMFLSMINTGSMTAANDVQSMQALYVAQGGMEYILQNRAFPNYSMGAATMNLGAGRFTASTPTYLTADPGAAGTTINVQSTAIFPNAGRITIDSELMTYTGKNATQFTGATRGVGGTAAVAHPTANASVYPVTTVTDNPLPAGNATINVTSNAGFSIPGVVIIDIEYIFCSGVNGTTQLTNCLRGYNGSLDVAHLNLSNVFQYAVTSTGMVDNAQRAVERSAARRVSGAMMVYAKLNGDGVPYYRRWDGTTWGPELTATAVPANIQYIIVKFARTRNEAILGTLSSNGDIRVQVWDGTGWGAATLMGNTTAANSVYRGFDIEYETGTDRAIVVYSRNVPNQVSYNILSGFAWTPQANQNLINPGSIGVPRWIELARNPLSTSNEIAMIVLGSTNTYVYGMRWTGAWDTMGTTVVWDTAASTSITKAVHVSYEQLSGRAMFVWGSTPRSINYRIWDGATLNLGAVTNQNIANIGAANTARWVRLAPDPYSNNMMLGIQDNDTSPDLITSLWNGAASVWDPNGMQHDNSLEDSSRNFDLVYETAVANAGRLWILWGNGSRLSRQQWNGAAWGGITTTGDDTSFVQLAAHPVSGAVLSGIYESTNSGWANRDIWESHLTQGSAIWSPRVVIWGGRTVAAPVMERLSLAAERYNPLFVQGWREIVK